MCPLCPHNPKARGINKQATTTTAKATQKQTRTTTKATRLRQQLPHDTVHIFLFINNNFKINKLMLLSVCWPTACSICWRRRPHDASLTMTHDPLIRVRRVCPTPAAQICSYLRVWRRVLATLWPAGN